MLAVTSPQGAVAEPYFPLEHRVNIGVADLHSFPEGNLSVIYMPEKKNHCGRSQLCGSEPCRRNTKCEFPKAGRGRTILIKCGKACLDLSLQVEVGYTGEE